MSFNPTFAPFRKVFFTFQPSPTKTPTWNPRVKTLVLGHPYQQFQIAGICSHRSQQSLMTASCLVVFTPATSMDLPQKKMLGNDRWKETHPHEETFQHHQSPTPDFVCYRSHSPLVPPIPGRLHEAWPSMLWKRPSATHARWGNAAWHKTPVSTSLRLMGAKDKQDQKVVNLSRHLTKHRGKESTIPKQKGLCLIISKNHGDMDA